MVNNMSIDWPTCASEALEILSGYDEGRKGYLTIGLSYRNPTTYDEPMTVGEIADYIEETGNFYWWKIGVDNNGELHATAYTDNDLF